MGAKVDMLFKALNKELGSGEVGKSKITAADDKYLNDGLWKPPKTLHDMLSLLVEKNPMQVNNSYANKTCRQKKCKESRSHLY